MTTVQIDVYRPRRLDKDNAYGGLKPLLDAMRDVGFIFNDSPKWLNYTVEQHVEPIQCRIEIRISYPR